METTTGCVWRWSGSGRLIIMVSTEPSDVPIHSVGSSVVGSGGKTLLPSQRTYAMYLIVPVFIKEMQILSFRLVRFWDNHAEETI